VSIVSSAYVADGHTQLDGRRYVEEAHTDSVGVVHSVRYLAPVGADYQAIANARASQIADALAEAEAQAAIDG
jgi:hypothetical protein